MKKTLISKRRLLLMLDLLDEQNSERYCDSKHANEADSYLNNLAGRHFMLAYLRTLLQNEQAFNDTLEKLFAEYGDNNND